MPRHRTTALDITFITLRYPSLHFATLRHIRYTSQKCFVYNDNHGAVGSTARPESTNFTRLGEQAGLVQPRRALQFYFAGTLTAGLEATLHPSAHRAYVTYHIIHKIFIKL